MGKQLIYDYRHWGANKIVMEIINKLEKSPETIQLNEKRKDITKHGNLRFKFDSSLNRNVWVPRRPDKRGRDEMATICLEFLLPKIEDNRWG